MFVSLNFEVLCYVGDFLCFFVCVSVVSYIRNGVIYYFYYWMVIFYECNDGCEVVVMCDEFLSVI